MSDDLLATDSSTHRRLERDQLADIWRRDRRFPSSIILTLGTFGHTHTSVLCFARLYSARAVDVC